MTGLTKRLLVISLDAAGSRDFEYMCTLPHFKGILDRGSVCTQVSSVYPSLTYPAHSSIVTGLYPDKHRVINNTRFQPWRERPDWYWQRRYIQGETIFDKAKARGLSTCAIMWPVTAKSDITYNMPEIFANRPWTNQVLTSVANGSIFYQAVMMKKFGHLLNGIRQPALDHFTHEVLKETLRRYQPEVTFVHFTDVDTQRHLYGVDSPEARAALKRHDGRLGEIIGVLEETGLMSETTLCVLGDHCQIDTHTIVYLNHVFKEKGWLNGRGRTISSWQVICKNCDGSAYIYINKSGLDKETYKVLKQEVYRSLCELKQDGRAGIEGIYTGKEAGVMGADHRCAFMVEALPGYYYLDGCEVFLRPVAGTTKAVEPQLQKATHGYHPGKADYATFFMAAGPGIAKGGQSDAMNLTDEALLFARLLGVELPMAQGRLPKGFLDREES